MDIENGTKISTTHTRTQFEVVQSQYINKTITHICNVNFRNIQVVNF